MTKGDTKSCVGIGRLLERQEISDLIFEETRKELERAEKTGNFLGANALQDIRHLIDKRSTP